MNKTSDLQEKQNLLFFVLLNFKANKNWESLRKYRTAKKIYAVWYHVLYVRFSFWFLLHWGPIALIIANFYLILVEYGATYNNILSSPNKWYETEKSATSRRAVK